MNEITVKAKPELSLFVPHDLDDYGLDPYEFRIYSRIARRGGSKGESWESIPNMAHGCCMSVSRAREATRLLEAAGMISNIERSGQSTIRRLTPRTKWVSPERLYELRKWISSTKSTRAIKSDTPSKNVLEVLAEPQLLPLAKTADKDIPTEGTPNKKYPTSLWGIQSEVVAAEIEKRKVELVSPMNEVYSLSEQLVQLVQSTLEPVFNSLMQRSNVLLSKAIQSSLQPQVVESTNNKPVSSSSCVPHRFLHIEELAHLVNEPVDNLQLNSNLTAALAQYPNNVEDAWVYFKQASATWSKKPGVGLFISAVKKGLKPSFTKSGSGWKEWADEAIRRRLMSYSQSKKGDIAIHFTNGVQRLWSEVRSRSWSEIEQLANVV